MNAEWSIRSVVGLLAGLFILCLTQPAAAQFGLGEDIELVEARTEVPNLAAAGTYVPEGDTISVELSEYAGYSGLIVANGGMEPNENSIFFKKHGFKVKLSLSEEES